MRMERELRPAGDLDVVGRSGLESHDAPSNVLCFDPKNHISKFYRFWEVDESLVRINYRRR